ncbi:hypothetical protein Gogos_019964, partial [Gossypium gossypioides]|nr:hypothetical protein [Gossypium gossypioides]
IVVYDGGYRLYKDSLKDRPIFVKKYDSNYPLGSEYYAYKDIVIGSQMSGYKNVLKVLGCCLETQNPSVVYEFACKSLSRSLSAISQYCHGNAGISLPQGQAHVEDAVIGRIGLSAPEYVTTGYLTEKADVYLFGMLLLELLGGRKLTIVERNILDTDEKHCAEIFSNFVDPRISIKAEQLMVVATLILRCTCVDGEKRPTMMEVAKQLKVILKSC